MLVGMLYERRHTRLISEFGGLATSVPVYSTFFLIVVLSSLGLPLLNGFVGEFLIIVGSYYRHAAYAAFASAGVVLAAVYLLWMYQRVFYGEITNAKNRTLPDCDFREKLILTVLVIVIIAMGVYPQPFLRRMDRSVESLMMRMERHSLILTERAAPSPPSARLFPYLSLETAGSNQNPSPLPGERLADEGGRVKASLAIATKTVAESGSDPSPALVPRAPSPQGRGLAIKKPNAPGPRQTATSQLPTACCQVPAASRPLPTAYCPLPTVSVGGGR